MKHSEYSAVIVGSGAAGLFAALKLSSQINCWCITPKQRRQR